MYHTLRSCQTPFAQELDLAILVDSLSPSSITTVLLNYTTRFPPTPPTSTPPSPTSLRSSPPTFSPSPGRNVTFFSTDPSQLFPLLQRYVNLTAQFDFAGVERHYRPLLTDLLTWWTQQPHPAPISIAQEYDPCYQYAYTSPLPPSPSPSPTHPPFTLSTLPADLPTATRIASHWPYSSPSTASLVRGLLSQFDSVGAWSEGGELIGWVVRQMYGALGMVHVRKEERGKGVGRAMIREVVRRQLEHRKRSGGAVAGGTEGDEVVDECTPFCYINNINTASLRLFTSVGFIRQFEIDWVSWTPTPAVTSDAVADG